MIKVTEGLNQTQEIKMRKDAFDSALRYVHKVGDRNKW